MSWQWDCRGRTGVVGARPNGLDWLTCLTTSQPTSPWYQVSYPVADGRHPFRSVANPSENLLEHWLENPSKDGATCISQQELLLRWSIKVLGQGVNGHLVGFPKLFFLFSFFEAWIFFFARFDVVVSQVYKWYLGSDWAWSWFQNSFIVLKKDFSFLLFLEKKSSVQIYTWETWEKTFIQRGITRRN